MSKDGKSKSAGVAAQDAIAQPDAKAVAEAKKGEAKTQILVVSLLGSTSLRLMKALDAALKKFPAIEGANNIVFLPGAKSVEPHKVRWPADAEAVAKACADAGFASVFEAHTGRRTAYYVFDAKGRLLTTPIEQVVFTSKCPEPAYEALHRETQKGGNRIFTVAGIQFGLLVCGENNLMMNEQSNNNEVVLRHGLTGALFPGCGVVLNGAHTPMGNWGKLTKRFEYLSDERWAFFATNHIDPEADWSTQTARVSVNGALIADGMTSADEIEKINEKEMAGKKVKIANYHDADNFIALSVVGPTARFR